MPVGQLTSCVCPMLCSRSSSDWRAVVRPTSCASGLTAATPAKAPSAHASSPACAAGVSDMSTSLEFLVGLLEQAAPIQIDWEDFQGVHGDILRSCQEAGVVASDPLVHPVPSCPHCCEGVPYRLAGQH